MMSERVSRFKTSAEDIRFWLVFLFAIRLFGVTNPPLEVAHNWRQSLTNMIARNFYEIRANLLYPMIDMAGEKTGIIGSEFPFFNYLIYLFSEVLGYDHWYGRLINLIVSSIGIYYFYLLLKDLLNKRVAFHSAILLSLSIWFAYSRKIMPDTFSVALVIIGLYYALVFLEKGSRKSLLLFFVMTTLGMLCKIPALALFSILALVPFTKRFSNSRKIQLLGTAALGFMVVCWWYFYWVPHLVETFKFQLYFPKGLMEGIQEILPLWGKLLERFYFSALGSFVALVCCLAGLFILIRNEKRLLKWGVALIFLVFVAFILKTGSVFPLHNYYIIPFVPVMALLGGLFLARIPSKYAFVLLLLIGVESIANQQHEFFIKEEKLYKLDLDSITEKTIPPKSLIIINGGGSPQDIYFSHRKGWTVTNEVILNLSKIDSLQSLGAQYLIVDKTTLRDFDCFDCEEVFSDDHYDIIKL